MVEEKQEIIKVFILAVNQTMLKISNYSENRS